jgi:hypothetical protein
MFTKGRFTLLPSATASAISSNDKRNTARTSVSVSVVPLLTMRLTMSSIPKVELGCTLAF